MDDKFVSVKKGKIRKPKRVNYQNNWSNSWFHLSVSLLVESVIISYYGLGPHTSVINIGRSYRSRFIDLFVGENFFSWVYRINKENYQSERSKIHLSMTSQRFCKILA